MLIIFLRDNLWSLTNRIIKKAVPHSSRVIIVLPIIWAWLSMNYVFYRAKTNIFWFSYTLLLKMIPAFKNRLRVNLNNRDSTSNMIYFLSLYYVFVSIPIIFTILIETSPHSLCAWRNYQRLKNWAIFICFQISIIMA